MELIEIQTLGFVMNAAHDAEFSRHFRSARFNHLLKPLPLVFAEALCASSGLPASIWDVSVEGESRIQMIARRNLAMRVCADCPIRALCLRTAEADPMATGVWGGQLFNPKLKNLGDEENITQAQVKPCSDSTQQVA